MFMHGLAVADVFDALMHSRVLQTGMASRSNNRPSKKCERLAS